MKLRVLAGLAFVALLGSAAAQTSGKAPRAQAPPQLPVWDRLERFADDTEFLNYVRAVQRFSGAQRRDYEGGVADMAVPSPPPPPPPPASVAPTASALGAAQAQPNASEPSSITNVQTQGVDEGGIVKQVGRFLIVLQDGRLFVVDTRDGNQPGLSLAARANVYRSSTEGTWYDEVLTSGNRILVTGYSYREAASEVTIFTINDAGQLTRETTYYITSNDYYDPENYSTRLVNGNLVIYTPLDVRRINPQRVRWPIVRRWLRDGEHRAETTAGRSLFDAEDIYKPITRTQAPLIHSVSVCPLGELRSGDELDCRTTAFAGAAQREFFVSTNDIYLWLTPGWGDQDRCASNASGADAHAARATLFQVPLNGASPRAAHVRGQPSSQLALDASLTEFRALLGWNTSNCTSSNTENDLRYFRVPLSSLSTTPREAPTRSYTRVPSPGAGQYEVRFTDTHVTYGGRGGYTSYPPGEGQGPQTARVITVAVARPTAAVQVNAPHSVIRMERAGNDIVLTGYRTDAGLSLSVLDLGSRPRITDTQLLQGRFESENRSHAFNSFIGQDGSGLMGLPTVTRVKESGRWVWRSQASDVSFLSVDAGGQLADIGALSARPNAQHPSYRCEVSCVDWYGNTRALYIGNRVFGLSATELIEGAVANGRISEVRRLNLSAPLSGARASFP